MKKRVKILLWILWVIILLWTLAFCFFRPMRTSCCDEVVPNCCNKNIAEYENCTCGGEVISSRQDCACGIQPLLNPNGTVRTAYDNVVEKKCNKEWGEMHYISQPNNHFEICIFKDETCCYIEDFDNWECNKLNIEELWPYRDLWKFSR